MTATKTFRFEKKDEMSIMSIFVAGLEKEGIMYYTEYDLDYFYIIITGF